MGPFEFVLPSTHGATCVYFGVFMHICGGEGLAHKVRYPIMEIVLMRCD